MEKLLFVVTCAGGLYGCSIDSRKHHSGKNANPPAGGFDLAGSDTRAIEIADRVMIAMGGRKSWDESRFLKSSEGIVKCFSINFF